MVTFNWFYGERRMYTEIGRHAYDNGQSGGTVGTITLHLLSS
jgi:hypothetical protein